MAKKQKRFEVVYKETKALTEYRILLDRETGIHYLICDYGSGPAMTPLLDMEGRPYASFDFLESEREAE